MDKTLFGPAEETTLLDLVTDPGLQRNEWLVREVDERGPFIIALEEIIANEDPDHCAVAGFWERPIRVQWNEDMSAAVLVSIEHIERHKGDPSCTVLLNRRMAFGKF